MGRGYRMCEATGEEGGTLLFFFLLLRLILGSFWMWIYLYARLSFHFTPIENWIVVFSAFSVAACPSDVLFILCVWKIFVYTHYFSSFFLFCCCFSSSRLVVFVHCLVAYIFFFFLSPHINFGRWYVCITRCYMCETESVLFVCVCVCLFAYLCIQQLTHNTEWPSNKRRKENIGIYNIIGE